MGQFKSGIILKDRVFIPEYDSYTDMLEELGIEYNERNAENTFIKAELIPKNNDVFSDVETWGFVVNQDILPDWYVEEYDKKRMIRAVKDYAKTHIHMGLDFLHIERGTGHYIKDCENVIISKNAQVDIICGNTSVYIITGSAKVYCIKDNVKIDMISGDAAIDYIKDRAEVNCVMFNARINCMQDSAKINKIIDNVIIDDIRGNAQINCAAGGSIIKRTNPWSPLNRNKLKLFDKAILIDYYDEIIYQSGRLEYGNSNLSKED